MIALVTDSSSQLPDALRERFDVTVVPLTVTIDGAEYTEGVDLDADGFWALFDDHTPEVTTSQPSPGAFAAAYAAAAGRGADAILSIHVGSAFSGTLASATLAARQVDVPVRLVDTETASFGVSCCVWEAARLLERGADLERAAAGAESLGPDLRSVFVVGALEFALRGGRIAIELPEDTDDVPVIATTGPAVDVIGSGRTVDDLCEVMATAMQAEGRPIRAALCIADAAAEPFRGGLEHRLRQRTDVVDIVHYRLGPSVGAHTGPGTAGGFWYPLLE